MSTSAKRIPPGQQVVAAGKWPVVGEHAPDTPPAEWRVSLSGLVERPAAFTLTELRQLPQHRQVMDIHCVTRWSKPAVTFRGVLLADLLERAGRRPAARYVSFVAHSSRRHSTSLPLATALELGALVALEADAAPLPAIHGGPMRVVVPQRYFYKSLKWLTEIELLAEDRLGYWEATAGYHNGADPWQEQRYVASGISKNQAAELVTNGNLQDRQLLGLAVAGRILPGLLAQRATLRDADFRGCDLARARFDQTNLSNAHFEHANLRGANFDLADLEGANFAGADLRGASLLAASMIAATFLEANSGAGALLDCKTLFPRSAFEQLTPDQEAYVRAQNPSLVENQIC